MGINKIPLQGPITFTPTREGIMAVEKTYVPDLDIDKTPILFTVKSETPNFKNEIDYSNIFRTISKNK